MKFLDGAVLTKVVSKSHLPISRSYCELRSGLLCKSAAALHTGLVELGRAPCSSLGSSLWGLGAGRGRSLRTPGRLQHDWASAVHTWCVTRWCKSPVTLVSSRAPCRRLTGILLCGYRMMRSFTRPSASFRSSYTAYNSQIMPCKVSVIANGSTGLLLPPSCLHVIRPQEYLETIRCYFSNVWPMMLTRNARCCVSCSARRVGCSERGSGAGCDGPARVWGDGGG
jgi:hypothetical protein